MKEKIKILIAPTSTEGVGYFRSIWPAQSMQKNFSDDVEVEIKHDPDVSNMEYLKSFDIIHFHRSLGPYEGSAELFPKLREAGVTLIMDIDDFWDPPSTHPLYAIAQMYGLSQKSKANLKLVDYVTTTTDIFAEYIKKYNNNVKVIPNALDMTHEMWTSQPMENKTDKCRIAWIGGAAHLYDIELMRDGFQRLWGDKELTDTFQIVLSGFDTSGDVLIISKTGERKSRPIKPHESVWCKFEEIFTANYKDKANDPEYYTWLKKLIKPTSGDYEDEQYVKNYVRRWYLPLNEYGTHYDYSDVCLAPLASTFEQKLVNPDPGGRQSDQIETKKNEFNDVKSELKIIEAGMKKKALIAQDFGIYSKLIEDGVTGLLVKDDKKDWYTHMKRLIEDPEYRQTLAHNLHEYVKDKYELKNVTKDRVNFYKQIVERSRHNE